MQAWYCAAWLWKEGAPGALAKEMVWHDRHSRFTLLTFSRWALGEPCGVWQDSQPSTLTGSCSKTNGPRLSAWQVKQTGPAPPRCAPVVRDGAMRVMAIAALDQTLVHAMVKGHFELRLLLQVAPVAKLGLRLDQQKLGCRGVMRRMARNATDVVLGMNRIEAFICWVPPAWQVKQRSLISFVEAFWKVKILRQVAGIIDMLCSRPMTTLAALV